MVTSVSQTPHSYSLPCAMNIDVSLGLHCVVCVLFLCFSAALSGLQATEAVIFARAMHKQAQSSVGIESSSDVATASHRRRGGEWQQRLFDCASFRARHLRTRSGISPQPWRKFYATCLSCDTAGYPRQRCFALRSGSLAREYLIWQEHAACCSHVAFLDCTETSFKGGRVFSAKF